VLASDDKVTIIATGPLTNIAEFITTYPRLKDKIQKIVIMGGAIHVKGNIQALDSKSDNTVAEWNIYADPKAAEIVFSSKIPVTLVPLDATNQVPMTEEFYKSLSQQSQPALKLIYQLLKVIVDNYGMEIFINEFYLWDTLSAMICLDPKIAVTEVMSILVNLETAQTKHVEDDPKRSSIHVATKIPDAELILTRLIKELKSNLLVESKSTHTNLFKKPKIVQSNETLPQGTRSISGGH
jgi:inosine-uridine nucleoside N-ribohydrolase